MKKVIINLILAVILLGCCKEKEENIIARFGCDPICFTLENLEYLCQNINIMEYRFNLQNLRTGEIIEIREPVGFDSFAPILKRSEQHGMMIEFPEKELQFEGQGRELIENEFKLYGINSQILLTIEYKCGDSWDEFYSGNLVFSVYNTEESDACFAKLSIGKTGVQMQFKNRWDIKIDLEDLETLDGENLAQYECLGRELNIPGKTILVENHAKLETELQTTSQFVSKTPFGKPVSGEIGTFFSQDNFVSILWDNPLAAAIFTNESDITVNDNFEVSLNFKVRVRSMYENPINDPGFINVYIMDASNNVLKKWQADFHQSGTGYFDQIREISINEMVNIPKGCSLCSMIGIEESNWYVTVYSGAYIRITGTSLFAPTNAKTFMVHETLSRVTESITNNELTVKSDYYGRTDSEVNPVANDGAGSLRAFTNGYNLRRAVFEDGTIPQFFASFKELYEGLNAIDNIGFGIEGDKLRIEPMNYFYSDDVVLKCENVAEVKKSIDFAKCFGIVNIGYEKWESDGFNSIDGFHTKRQYRTNLNTDQKFDMFCKFLADSYSIEITRRRMISDNSKDWKYDNDRFIFDLTRQISPFKVTTGNGDNNTLIDAEGVFNVEISPLRNLMRWYAWITQAIYPAVSNELIFAASEGYSGAITQSIKNNPITSGMIAENSNIDESKIAIAFRKVPIFDAMKLSFEYPLTMKQFDDIRNSPYSLIQCNDDYGWISSIEYKITDGLAQFELIEKRG